MFNFFLNGRKYVLHIGNNKSASAEQELILTYSSDQIEFAQRLEALLNGVRQKRPERKKLESTPATPSLGGSYDLSDNKDEAKHDNPHRQCFLDFISCLWSYFDFDKDGNGCKVWGVSRCDIVEGEDSIFVQKEFSKHVAQFISLGHSNIALSCDRQIQQSLIKEKGISFS